MAAHICMLCDTAGEYIAFCTACNFSLCDDCWDVYPPHKKKLLGPQGLPHEKANPSIVQELRNCMDEPTDENEQRLHQQDEETTWFGLERDEVGTPVLAEYRRYAAIMMQASEQSDEARYPSLVSFIGQTGAGKSSLIKLLVDLKSSSGPENIHNIGASPVIGRSASAVPTSADVHLYLSPDTTTTKRPVLYADCEGFNGGEQNPVAVNAIMQESNASGSTTNGSSKQARPTMVQKVSQGTKRLLKWASRDSATYEETSKRGYTVSEMYPRIFYAFSDVVVFVLDNPKTLEVIVERLLEWADTNYSQSINQPVKPHAVIVLNKSGTKTPDDQWSTINATAHLLSTTTARIADNRTFAKYAKLWKERSSTRIDSMHDLLRCYYSTVHVVRIPEKSRYQLLNRQRQQLHSVIAECCEMSFREKQERELLTDVDEFGLYLSLAFDHFSETLDEPFNFVEASLKRNPSSNSLADDLLIFARYLGIYKRLDGQLIPLFNYLAPFVASCILLESARKQRIGRPEDWYGDLINDDIDGIYRLNRAKRARPNSYRDMCRRAIHSYYGTDVPCDHIVKDTLLRNHRRCTVRQKFHYQTHKAPATMNVGSIQDSGGFESNVRPTFLLNWEKSILEHMTIMHDKFKQANVGKFRASVAQAHAGLLATYYQHPKSAKPSQSFKMNSICIACLCSPPQHLLGCGHVICSQCARDFGEVQAGKVIVHTCPMGDDESSRLTSRGATIPVAPAYSGLRVLTLDGGGVRGIVELYVLKAIQDCVGIDIQHCFDLVVGTSTGGIIALGLGHLGWTVDECIQKFRELVHPIFTKRTMQRVSNLRYIQLVVKHSKYETTPLEKALKDAFDADSPLFPTRLGTGNLKTAVTAASNSGTNAWVLSNYATLPGNDKRGPRYKRYRPVYPLHELRTWEAARSTSAAPGFFKPFAPYRQGYHLDEWIDGALLHNNPIEIAVEEAHRIAETESLCFMPDVVLSIGTGLSKNKTKGNETPAVETNDVTQQKVGWLKRVFTIVSFQVKLNMNAESRWEQVASNDKDLAKRMYRINPDLDMEPPLLDDVASVMTLAKVVPEMLEKDWQIHQRIRQVSAALVASMFYFEGEGSPINMSSSMTELHGWIRCRLTIAEQPQIAKFFSLSTRPEFVLYNSCKDSDDIHIPVPMSKLENRTFTGLESHLVISGDDVATTIALRLPGISDRKSEFPISGFPRQLLKLDFGIK